MKQTSTPLVGLAFNDVLNELHQIVFQGIPGETPPFTLTTLEREYIAFTLACYYQCEHCIQFHERAVNLQRRKTEAKDWDWKNDLVSTTLFLHLDGRKLSAMEWDRWIEAWQSYAKKIDKHQAGISAYISYAVGIARNDSNLMNLSFDSISAATPDNETLKSIIREIDSVVIFMKAATSKNRSDATILNQLKSRGVSMD